MGIGRFQLSNKTLTQTDNATGGLVKGGKGKWGQTEVLGNTEGPHKTKNFEKITTMLKIPIFEKSPKNVREKQTLITALYLTKILLQCTWKKWNLFSTNQFILGWQSSISQKL